MKGVFYCCSTIYSHSTVFLNEHYSYLKMGVKLPLSCNSAILLTSVNKGYLLLPLKCRAAATASSHLCASLSF